MIKVDNLDDIKEQCKVAANYTQMAIDSSKSYREVEDLRRLKQLYSKHIPVKAGSIVVDYKILSALLKKIKHLKVDVVITKSALIIRYRDPRKEDAIGGVFTLSDLSDYYKDFKRIPTAVIEVNA